MRTHPYVLSLAAALCVAPSVAGAEERLPRYVEASDAWDDSEAAEKCSAAAADNARWTGEWRVALPGQSIFCQVVDLPEGYPTRQRGRARRVIEAVEVGRIWSQADAEEKCPRAAAALNGSWTSHWKSPMAGWMSDCDIAVDPEPPVRDEETEPRVRHAESEPRVRDVEAGPIWSDGDAQIKRPVAAYAVGGEWTGQWRTVAPGKMSVCRIAERRRDE